MEEKIYLGLGSNQNPAENIRLGLQSLMQCFGSLELSPMYESEPVGFQGDNFLNLVVGLSSDLGVGEMQAKLRAIEDEHGRDRANISGNRLLDIDLLMMGDKVGVIEGVVLPREEILLNAFVLKPFSDLCPQLIHPGEGRSLGELWLEYQSPQKIWPADLNLL